MNALTIPVEVPNRNLWEKCCQIIRNFKDHPLEFLGLLSLALFFATIFVAEVVAGVFSSAIVSDSTALSTSPTCGLWRKCWRSHDFTIYDLDPLEQVRERATAYADDCYTPNATGICSDFYHQKISYTEKYE